MAAATFVAFTAAAVPILEPLASSSTSKSYQTLASWSRIEFRSRGGEFWRRALLSSRSCALVTRSSSSDGVMASAQGGMSVDAEASTSTSPAAEAADKQKEAAVLVQEFYAAINRREISSIGDLFADECVYEDLVFPKPFVGRKAILAFFQKFMDSVGPELEFRVDDITSGDPNAAGVIWHLEWRGKPLPFSKGCSFYRCNVLNGNRQFVYGRDAVEPATKPGDFTLVALKGLAALLRRFPSLADSMNRFKRRKKLCL